MAIIKNDISSIKCVTRICEGIIDDLKLINNPRKFVAIRRLKAMAEEAKEIERCLKIMDTWQR